MASCQHRYARAHPACPHPATEGTSHCVWHSPRVRKHDAYVPSVLAAADRTTGGDLDGFRLAGLLWPGAALSNRHLRDADLRDAVLDGGDLAGADLSAAVLRRASLKRVSFARATLAGADLAGANLQEADLRGADLSGTDLTGASLLGADLREANLTGARLGDVRFNARTRVAGAIGLDAHPALTALAQHDPGDGSMLAEADDEDDRRKTRSFAPAGPAHGHGHGRGALIAAAVAAALFAGGAGLVGGTTLGGGPAPPPSTNDATLIAQTDDLRRQGEAYVARIKELEAGMQGLLDQRDSLHQDAHGALTEVEGLRHALRHAQGEAARLRGRDDRAALAIMDLDRVMAERERLSGALTRQARLATILAEGVNRVEAERSALVTKLADLGAASDRAALLQAEREQIRHDLAQAMVDRDAQRERAERLAGELGQARDEIQRYLARVNGTGLEDYLATDLDRLPLVPVASGSTVALGGDYTITLRLDAGAKPGVVNAALTLQRPAALATPDVAIVLYDRDRRPLRRIAYSFPHIDAGTPFAAATTSIACDRFPAFARVLVAPGVTVAER